MKLARILLAFLVSLLYVFAGAAGTTANGTNLCVNVVAGTNTTTLGNQYTLSVMEVSADGRWVLYGAGTNARANEVYTDMGSNSSVISREVTPAASLAGKGSTIPVLGGRASSIYLNQSFLDSINYQPTLAASSGRTVRVAILDTGLAATVGADIRNKVVAETNLVDNTSIALDAAIGLNSNHDGILDGEVGHGTMVASIINTVAPQAELIVVRISDSDGQTNSWDIMKGVQFAIDNGAEVINMSFGSLEKSPLIKQAVAYAESHGAVVVSGVGNSNTEESYYPAKISTVISVAAVNPDRTKSSFSNWAGSVDVAAPGYSIATEYLTGLLGQWEGTSFSAAYVSGIISDCLRRRSAATPQTVRKALRKSGVKVDTSNPDFVKKLGKLLDHAALNAALTSPQG